MFFSVITPAFNAQQTIRAVFESLNAQTFKSFEWIVIDDGSEDDTSLVVADLKSTGSFPITVLRTANNHKKGAIGEGLKLASGFMSLIADADDTFPEDALQHLYECWQALPDKTAFNGITGLCVDQNGQIIGDCFPQSPMDCDLIEMRLLHRIEGEKWGCVITAQLREVYPDFSGVAGHIPEGIYQRKLANKKQRCVNKVIRIYHTNVAGSITNSGFNPINAQGILLDAIDWLDNYKKYFKIAPLHFIKRAAAYNKYLKYLTAAQRSAVKPQTGFARLLILLTVCARFL